MKTIKGNNKDNTLAGKARDERIIALGGDDILNGFGGDDSLIGGKGGDLIYVSAGKDTIDGGKGVDLLHLYHAEEGISLDLANRKVTFEIEGEESSARYKGIEGAYGSQFDDTLRGNDGKNYLYGEYGNDTLYCGDGDDQFNGYWGDDHMDGEDGNDRFFVQYGNDTVIGGDGSDTLDFVFANTFGIEIDLSEGTVDYYRYGSSGPGTGVTVFSDIENVSGSALSDTITGDGEANYLAGENGDDAIDGMGNHDMLDGGLGNDTVTGGDGQDGFVFTTKMDSAGNVDTIQDFVIADDAIYLDDKIFAKLQTSGPVEQTDFFDFRALKSVQFQAGSGTEAGNASIRMIYDKDTGLLYYDSNGSKAGQQTLIAQLDPDLELTASHFFVL